MLEYLLPALAVAALSFGSGLVPLYTKLRDVPLKYWLAFAAGVLLATAFFEMIPESFGLHEEDEDHHGESSVMLMAGGFFIFYLIEHLIIARGHNEKYHDHNSREEHVHHTGYLGIFALAMDNIVDGAAIAASWLLNPILGITVTTAVIAHEIPHSLATVAILRSAGANKKKIILTMLAVSLLFPISATLVALTGIELTHVLAFTAGAFIYFGATHLLPESHQTRNMKVILAFTIGALAIFLGSVLLAH